MVLQYISCNEKLKQHLLFICVRAQTLALFVSNCVQMTFTHMQSISADSTGGMHLVSVQWCWGSGPPGLRLLDSPIPAPSPSVVAVSISSRITLLPSRRPVLVTVVVSAGAVVAAADAAVATAAPSSLLPIPKCLPAASVVVTADDKSSRTTHSSATTPAMSTLTTFAMHTVATRCDANYLRRRRRSRSSQLEWVKTEEEWMEVRLPDAPRRARAGLYRRGAGVGRRAAAWMDRAPSKSRPRAWWGGGRGGLGGRPAIASARWLDRFARRRSRSNRDLSVWWPLHCTTALRQSI